MTHAPFITTTEGMAGHFAVLLTWNPEYGGFYEPWNSGFGRYATQEEAEREAIFWAESEHVAFKPRPPQQHDNHVWRWRIHRLRQKLELRRGK